MFLCFEKIKKSSKSSAYLSVFIVNAHDDEKKAKENVCGCNDSIGWLAEWISQHRPFTPIDKKKKELTKGRGGAYSSLADTHTHTHARMTEIKSIASCLRFSPLLAHLVVSDFLLEEKK